MAVGLLIGKKMMEGLVNQPFPLEVALSLPLG